MDFKKHRVLIAASVLVVLVGTLVLLERNRAAEYADPTEVAESPLPTLVRDQITSIEIVRPGVPTVRLDKSGENFVLAVPVEAQTDASNVNGMIDKLVSLEFVSVVSTSRNSHTSLEVDDAQAIRVLVKAGDRTAADLRIGVFRGGNTMVRVAGSDQVVSVRGSVRYVFSREVREWRDRVITDLTPETVQRISIESPEGTFGFERNAEGNFTQVARTTPIAGFDSTRVADLVSSLSRLRATDFGGEEAANAFATPRGKVTLFLRTPATEDGGAAQEEQVVLVLGATHGEGGDAYVQRQGNATAFIVAAAAAEKLHPSASAFVPPPPSATPPAAPPGGSMGLPMGADGQIPPELLQQLMQQAGAQGH